MQREPIGGQVRYAPLLLPVLLGVGCLILPATTKFFTNGSIDVIVPALCALIVLTAMMAARQSRRHLLYPYIDVKTMVFWLFAVRYALGASTALLWRFSPWVTNYSIHTFDGLGVRENLGGACQLVLAGFVGILAGFSIRPARLCAYLPRLHPLADFDSLRTNCKVFIPALTVMSLLVLPKMSETFRHIGDTVTSINYVLIAFCGFWAAREKSLPARLKWILLAAVASLPFVITNAELGMREGFLHPLICYVLGHTAANRRIPWIAFTVIAAVMFFAGMPVLNAFKSVSNANSYQGLPDRFHQTVSALESSTNQTSMDAIGVTLLRGNGIIFPAVYMQFYPEIFPFENGATFVDTAKAFIPRVIWPDKPNLSARLNEFAKQTGLVAQSDEKTSATFDGITEWYINFGLRGVFFGCCLHALYLNVLYTWLVTYFNPLVGSLCCAVLIILNHDFFGVVQLIASDIKTVPVWIVLLVLLSARTYHSKGHFNSARLEPQCP